MLSDAHLFNTQPQGKLVMTFTLLVAILVLVLSILILIGVASRVSLVGLALLLISIWMLAPGLQLLR